MTSSAPSDPPRFPWHSLVTDSSLEQGDFFFDFPVFEPVYPTMRTSDPDPVIADVTLYDVIVLSQSCDLVAGKLESVLVCPHFPLETAEQFVRHLQTSRGKNDVRHGIVAGYHRLAACELPEFSSTIRIVSFRQVFSVPFSCVQAHTQVPSPRLGLLPPYREHLAQAFAGFIMRVGLPADIPPF